MRPAESELEISPGGQLVQAPGSRHHVYLQTLPRRPRYLLRPRAQVDLPRWSAYHGHRGQVRTDERCCVFAEVDVCGHCVNRYQSFITENDVLEMYGEENVILDAIKSDRKREEDNGERVTDIWRQREKRERKKE